MFERLSAARGLQKACEIQYSIMQDDGTVIPTSGVARMKQVSGDPTETYNVVDLVRRYTYYKCAICMCF